MERLLWGRAAGYTALGAACALVLTWGFDQTRWVWLLVPLFTISGLWRWPDEGSGGGDGGSDGD